ncbi:hypothetical protein D0869_02751 [Hortaea werneckii]|uniref:L-lactate dehydrogenase (cytochrome) n=1 Tax=Hortaea werneckii TaxID=91943 RepID=A0A3M7AFI7_HORWE|nr:cytochrome b2 [Hortaea werneckii]KAI7028060.1 cytochrome b2 [Hortaea werneckii]KAI7198353.1 cytochrome b2 [Hortaea werneckii]KAI7594956.1 cytochrome b2 [Hortaea werneckii]KAI7676717.1 cytochrome b2 [Hortaea werneckii]
MAGEALLSVEEIKRHNSPDDCWIVVDGKVWDITDFAPEHPGGGEIIWKHAGYDATTTYSTYHSPSLLPNNLDPSKLKGQVDTRTITPDWAKPPPSTTTELKLHEKPPLDTVICAQDFEDIAQRTASKKTWAFYSSASTDCVTRDANRSFFSRIWFRPRLLRAVGNISTKSSILGHDAGLPIFVSPAAMAKMMHPSGEKGIARGCLDERVPQCVSNNASFPIGEIIPSVPKEKNHPFFFQLYVNKDRDQSTKLLQHVRSLGVDSVFVTIDGPVQGKREADERVKADESLSTPMSGQKAKNDRRGGGIGRIMGNYIDPNFTWADFAWLREHWKGKIVVKGVQCWQDAKKCADLGMDGVLLSNHGGRNLDSSPPVIMTLLECQMNCPEIFGQLEVLIDGGIRRGADVLKCLCLGATAVGFGRPFLYALNYGEEGVQHFIDIIKQELEIAMALVGITDLSQCDPMYVNTSELDVMVAKAWGHPYARGKRLGSQEITRAKL